jgi:hypothetical protein
MALTLIKETGAGLANANSYASASDGDSFHEGHIYATAWTNATTEKKEAALVMATRFIDACYQFNGRKASNTQALQWPREQCLDPDRAASPQVLFSRGDYFDETSVPRVVVDAACEFARELIKSDSTDAPVGQGIAQTSVAGGVFVQYDKKDTQPMVPKSVQMMLCKLGRYLNAKSGAVRLVRG